MARSGILFALSALFLFALFSAANAASCLAYPESLKVGGNCGFNTGCINSFCSKAGICTAYLAAGETCDSQTYCQGGLTCKGPDGSQKCVAYANPGEACNNTEVSLTPTCPYPLTCTDGTCINGQVGDGCTATSNCRGNLTCTGGVCTPLEDYLVCGDSADCKPESFCRDNVCRPKITEGLCTFNQCADGYVCVGYSNGDSPSCEKLNSRDQGEYCSSDTHCKSGRCHYNKCAKKVSECQGGGDCGQDQTCFCGSGFLDEGFGTCGKYPCLSKYNRLDDCIATHCKRSDTSYSKSCTNLNCDSEYKATSTGKCGDY